ncbi:HAD domain-containing protein [Hydrogenophaga atypica]|uniref:HAD domain-containing protein n=1 Tax=Hydrogenophaga atypica TaxID=249409 RepID=A0ABW2QW68_9BURK
MHTLFLDFDGVLHPEFCHQSKHFSCLPLLEAVLRQVPACDVVVTSTWRHQYPIEVLRDRFSSDIQPRVIGVTPRFSHLEDVPDVLFGYEREAECNAWLRDNGRVMAPWLAVDDRSWLFRPFNQFLFLVDGKTGLTAPMAATLAERLRRL